MQVYKNIAISDSGFIFNPSTGDSYSSNTIGLEIIQYIKEEKSKNEIVELISKRYNIDESTVEKDILDFLQILLGYQLIQDYEQ